MRYLCNMVLSILISVYNFNCIPLIKKLLTQLPPECEIVVADDASNDVWLKESNRIQLEQCDNVRYWESDKNLGRARIRNKLALLAKGEWILFLDCDALPYHNHFLTNYLGKKEKADVICGGTKGMENCPSTKVSLRYKYEKEYWKRHSAKERSKKPYESFTPFNFMIRKNVFEKIRFNELLIDYGHEDTLFGQELKKRGISILHIDNRAIHTGLDTNTEFLKKTECALASLLKIDPEFKFANRLTQTYLFLKRWHLLSLLNLWHSATETIERRNLLSSTPSLLVFQLYKLGYFCRLCRKKKV